MDAHTGDLGVCADGLDADTGDMGACADSLDAHTGDLGVNYAQTAQMPTQVIWWYMYLQEYVFAGVCADGLDAVHCSLCSWLTNAAAASEVSY